MTIEFKDTCKILIGKNEAGKSNILKAIAAVFGKYKVSDKDKRKRINSEEINDYYIRAVITLTDSEINEIFERLEEQFGDLALIQFENKKTLLQYLHEYFSKFLLYIKIGKNCIPSKVYFPIDSNKEYKLIEDLYIFNGKLSKTKQGNSVVNFNVANTCFNEICSLYEEKKYICHFWQYSDSYLIPHAVPIQTFITNPESFPSLYNIFCLCNRSNVKEEFDSALSEDGDYTNLLTQISEKTTQTFRNIWGDFKDTKIELISTSNEIITKISDKVKYSFEDRSDGFKRLISMLLILSTRYRSGELTNKDIILIDEPDQSLYPTSARYLRDELLNISKNCIVVYATHSQYMLDSNNIERHLIIEKKDDITLIKVPDELAKYSSDELLLNAIGTSIFECLKNVNLIFEGWMDKKVFETFCNKNKKEIDFNKIGSVYLGGISGVETLVQLLILAKKKFIIVSDSDSTSTSKKKTFTKDYSEYKDIWFDYGNDNINISTLEDFYEESYLEKELKKLDSNFSYDKNKNAIDNIGKVCKQDKELKQRIKNELADHIGISNMKNSYNNFVDKILDKIAILNNENNK